MLPTDYCSTEPILFKGFLGFLSLSMNLSQGIGTAEKNKNIKNPLRLMQNVSYETLMLWPSENPLSKLRDFQTPIDELPWLAAPQSSEMISELD